MADDGKLKRDDTAGLNGNKPAPKKKRLYAFPDEDNELNAAGFDWEVTKRLGSYVSPYKDRIFWAMLAALLSVFSSVVGPRLIGYVIEAGVRDSNLQLIGVGALAYVGVMGLGALGFRGQFFLMSVAGQRAIQALRDDLFLHINKLSMSFFSQYKTGRIISRLVNDVMVLREAITFAVVGTFRDVLVLVGIVISMATMNLPLTGIALSVLVVLVIIANFWRIYARRTYLRVRETNSKVNSELSEAFNGVRVTQAFDRQAYNYERFTKQIDYEHRSASVRASLVAALFFPSIELIGGAATGALIYAGGILVLDQKFDVETFVAFVLYIEQFFFPIRMLAQRYNIFQSVMAAGAKIFMLLDTPYEIDDAPDAMELPSITGHVSFEEVSFSYDEDSDDGVLSGINLEVPAGYMVALVGHTGAGKSTMIKLINRFYDVDKGHVLIDGYDVRSVTQNSLRSQIGVVLQEPYLFTGTIMENIRYGRLEATDTEVIEAATAVGAHGFISELVESYQTDVQEGGESLSSGQRQLLSFARALLADPRILILDEATSNIDTQTERIIQTALSRLLKGRTSFVVAHRLSTIVSSDLIVVMDRGEIVEQGTHADLLMQGGIYRGLYTMSAQ